MLKVETKQYLQDNRKMGMFVHYCWDHKSAEPFKKVIWHYKLVLNLHAGYSDSQCLQKYTNVSTKIFLEQSYKIRKKSNISRETVT